MSPRTLSESAKPKFMPTTPFGSSRPSDEGQYVGASIDATGTEHAPRLNNLKFDAELRDRKNGNG
jgi:hypothetical protein